MHVAYGRTVSWSLPAKHGYWQQGKTVEVRVNDEIPVWDEAGDLEGRYANCFKVGYNVFEMVIDFGQVTERQRRVRLTSRVVTNPRSAKALYETLGQSLEEYERTFGVIQTEKDD